MDGRIVCTPQHAESDSENNITSSPNAASVTDADKVINTKIDNTQVEGEQSEEELLKGLLTDGYCHVCEAVLLFESQRLSHYEGKKHAQKLKVYLQTKRAEKMNRGSTLPQGPMTGDKDRFCELCNMVFSSAVVAKSHYNGKVHAKNLHKQGLQPTLIDIKCAERHSSPRLTQASDNADQKSAGEEVTELLQEATGPTTTSSTEVDLKDPNRYCALCTASFNNPQMALQHYNGRKHQRNQARQDLLKEMGEDVQQAHSLMCQMCGVEFNSVEMYQAHMQGNKHQTREKKVVDLCKSQQKVYSSFADELADYVQVQKARGITPINSHLLPQVDREKEDEEDEEESDKADIAQFNKPAPNLPPISNPNQLHPGYYYPGEEWRPPYHGSPPNYTARGMSYGWDCRVPPSGHLSLSSLQFTNQHIGGRRRRCRKQLSSSYYTSSSSNSSSSYSSSYSSSTSDSDDHEYRHQERKRRIKRSRRDGGKRLRDQDSDKEQRRTKQQRRVREKDSEERRKSEAAESEEKRRKRRKNPNKARRQEKDSREENFEEESVVKDLKPEDLMEIRKGTEVHMEAEMNIEQQEGEQDEPGKFKSRKEKKRTTKEKADTRTEDEKLWDESILGC
ncbi:hypothetical protein LDENG_00022110 [Lucifuga dentata]|nr:hypothetical protein LDENG_00022110 [Lucifuga dentata]